MDFPQGRLGIVNGFYMQIAQLAIAPFSYPIISSSN